MAANNTASSAKEDASSGTHQRLLPLPLFWAVLLSSSFSIDANNYCGTHAKNRIVHRAARPSSRPSRDDDAACDRADENDAFAHGGFAADRECSRRINRGWKKTRRRRRRSPFAVGGDAPRNDWRTLRIAAASSVLEVRGGGDVVDRSRELEDGNDDGSGVLSDEESSVSAGSSESQGIILPLLPSLLTTTAHHAEKTTSKTTTATASNKVDDEDGGHTIRNNPHHHLNHEYKLKRGTRTTGAGASKRRNPSIFSAAAAKAAKGKSSLSPSRIWTAATLAGDVMNRPKTKPENGTRNRKKHPHRDDNPMLGRLWARRSERGTVIFRFPRTPAVGEGGGSSPSPVYVELSEKSLSYSENDNNHGQKNEENVDTPRAAGSSSLAMIHARYIAAEDVAQQLEPSASFVPIEGIYGVYDLPRSGPHAVLITESEEAYTSPPHRAADEGDDGVANPHRPLLELRRVKSLEIVPLRDPAASKSDRGRDGRRNVPPYSEEDESAEEARQLRLLRKSFREHDLYFTVPRSGDGTISVVRDVTHSLQRSFSEWASAAAAQRKDRGERTTGILGGKRSAVDHSGSNAQHPWWIPYIVEDSTDTRRSQSKRKRVVDPRFFWNEEPALSLLPPASPRERNAARGRGGDESDRENVARSPHALLLDHVVPVTSAFVGIQRGVPIPTSPSSAAVATAARKEKYDQILISRRSKYRTGTRFTRRGADDTGAVANYAETEQICLVLDSSDENNDDEKSEDSEVGDEEGDHPDSNDLLLEVYSHVQTRGSIPLHWSSPANVKAYRPRVYIGVDPVAQARGLRDHLLGELWWYSSSSSTPPSTGADDAVDTTTKIAMVNLIDKHGDQGRLGSAFDSVLSAVLDVYDDGSPSSPARTDKKQRIFRNKKRAQERRRHPSPLGPDSVEHIWYDFHAECKGGRWDRLVQLLERVTRTLDGQGYFCAVPNNFEMGEDGDTWAMQKLQDGVVRTNCMDCLDRTNVVQSMFGRHVLHRQLHERAGLSSKANNGSVGRGSRRRTLPLECVVAFKHRPLALPWTRGEAAHRHLWADNADAISRLYAGTPALKGDFTRTGKRTRRGALDDGLNSLQRYYLNNFIDADRQEGMDLLVGSAEFSAIPSDEDVDETSRAYVLRELAKGGGRRRGYDETHARIKLKSSGRTILGGGDEGRTPPELALKWLPGDLRHHMRSEALRSRSPLSPAAEEEDVVDGDDAPVRSSDFLLRVTSSAAGDDDGGGSPPPPDVDALEALRAIDRRASSPGRPWWVLSADGEDGNGGGVGRDPDGANLSEIRRRVRKVLGSAGKGAVAASLVLLVKVPVLSAALIVAAIATGLSDWDTPIE